MRVNASSVILDEVYRENFIAVDIVNFEIPDPNTNQITDASAVRLCNGGIDLSVQMADGSYSTFAAQGDFLGFSAMEDSLDTKLGKFSVQLSGVGNSMVQKFLGANFEGQPVQVAKVFLDYNTLQIIAVYVLYDGVIYNVTVLEDDKTCTISVDIASLWADFDKKAGRMTDNDSNWRLQGGNTSDKCFQKAGSVGQVSFQWGPKA